MNTIPIYHLKRIQPDVPEDRSYLCNKYIAHYGSPTSNIDLPSLQWGPKEEATKYTERTADFLITFAGAFFNYTLEKEEWKPEE